MNKIGRKFALLASVVPLIIGWILIITAQNIGTMIAGRVLLGIGGAAAVVIVPVYIGEISTKEIRGNLGAFFQVQMALGILFGFTVGAFVNVFWLSLICSFIPIIFLVLFIFLPESPAFLILKNRESNAYRSLKWLRSHDYDVNQELDALQIEENERKLVNKNQSLKETFSRKESIKSVVIVVGISIFQQICGVNVITFYTTEIFQTANTNIPPEIQTVIIGSIQVFMSLLIIPLVDKLGRRFLMISSGLIMMICTFLLGLYFFVKENCEMSLNWDWLPLFSLSLFIVGYSIGAGSVAFLIYGEICAPEIKGVAIGIAITNFWLFGFFVTKFFVNLVEAVGMGPSFWLYAAFNVLGTVFLYLILPETKGKTLVEIQKILKSNGFFVKFKN